MVVADNFGRYQLRREPKILSGGKMFDSRQPAVFYSGSRFLKHKMTRNAKDLWGVWSHEPPGYACVRSIWTGQDCEHRIK